MSGCPADSMPAKMLELGPWASSDSTETDYSLQIHYFDWLRESDFSIESGLLHGLKNIRRRLDESCLLGMFPELAGPPKLQRVIMRQNLLNPLVHIGVRTSRRNFLLKIRREKENAFPRIL